MTFAAPHQLLVGFRYCAVSGTTAYNNTWTVANVLSSTVAVLQIGTTAQAGGTYTATEGAGTFNRNHPGLYLHASSMASEAYVNDLCFTGGSSNQTEIENVFNVVMRMRGMAATLDSFCVTYPIGLGVCIGACAGAIALKDRQVAKAKVEQGA